jgi:hypothetical protein
MPFMRTFAASTVLPTFLRMVVVIFANFRDTSTVGGAHCSRGSVDAQVGGVVRRGRVHGASA